MVCPPGYECPEDGYPVLGGEANQILRRGVLGTEWVNVSAIQGTQGPQGAPGAQGMTGPAGPSGTIAGLSMAGNITAAQLLAALNASPGIVAHCPSTATMAPTSIRVRIKCASGSSAGVPTGHGSNCWRRVESSGHSDCASNWVLAFTYVSEFACLRDCVNEDDEDLVSSAVLLAGATMPTNCPAIPAHSGDMPEGMARNSRLSSSSSVAPNRTTTSGGQCWCRLTARDGCNTTWVHRGTSSSFSGCVTSCNNMSPWAPSAVWI